MSNRYSRQEEYKVKKKLVFENVRRVYFASLGCLLIIPLMMLINRSSSIESAGTIKGILIAFEVFSGVSAIVSVLAWKSRDLKLSTLVYRTFWFVFEMFSFVIIYADKVVGAGYSFYACMAIVMFLVPVMNLSEQIYYIVLLGVYSVFMAIKFSVGINDIFNLAITVVMLFTVSRFICVSFTEKLALQEHAREARDGESLDPMTGLLNRKGLEKRAYASFPECIADKRRVSMLMIDIDDMNRYNDSYGSDHGDDCIKSVSGLIRQIVLRNTDTICRLSGGRFLVYMTGGNDMEPVMLAEKVRSNVERKRIPHGRRAANPFVTVSIGVSSCVPRTESDFSELYDEAEDSLYDAKEHGKNITVYDEQIYGQYKRTAY